MKGKPEAATAVIELLMMGKRTPETWWAVNKRQDNKLENCCIWFVTDLNGLGSPNLAISTVMCGYTMWDEQPWEIHFSLQDSSSPYNTTNRGVLKSQFHISWVYVLFCYCVTNWWRSVGPKHFTLK
jgi:hypothetical protein